MLHDPVYLGNAIFPALAQSTPSNRLLSWQSLIKSVPVMLGSLLTLIINIHKYKTGLRVDIDSDV
jgi:hypothetical protein